MNGNMLYKVLLLSITVTLELSNADNLKMWNKGDRHNIFIFHIPSRYINATLGPETYGWIVGRFGQATVNRAGIIPSQSDSHVCGTKGWCKPTCTDNEEHDWTLKDICGRFFCCTDLRPLSLPG